MLTKENLEKIDSKGMYKVYDQWPNLARKAFHSELDVIEGNYSNFVLSGMGGSGALGDIFASILSNSKYHVDVVKGYHLPKSANSETLVISTSVSGNTTETLTVLEKAKQANCNIIAFSNGGIMQEFCIKNNIKHHLVKMNHSPRASLITFLYSMLKVLNPILSIGENEINESLDGLEKLKQKISSENLTESNSALELALWIKEMPVIYYPWGLQAAATRFKNSLQENCKIHVISEDIIEAAHNGIVAWSNPKKMNPILIKGTDDFIKTKELWKSVEEFFKREKIDYREIYSSNGSILTKISNLIYLLDYASVYHAVLTNIDPTPIEPINFIKNRLTSNYKIKF